MKYMGSKNRFAKELLPIMLENRSDRTWVEPFVGGANMIDKVEGKRIGSDYNEDLINLLKGLSNGWTPKESYTKEDYINAKNGLNNCKIETGYISINCSFSGKYWGRFAGQSNTKQGVRDYTNEAYKNVCKQTPLLKDIKFINCSYQDLEIPKNSIIYCDPPYENTYSDIEGYGKLNFNHLDFWEWCRTKTKEGHKVFVSEYKAPEDFKCVWEKETKSSLSANGKSGGNKLSTEKLFVYCG
ncbi:DNA adenine methylase [Flavobacteriaceae bacterium]|nr:DNA adenine methylase [Flavobacteriaceae bacterium]